MASTDNEVPAPIIVKKIKKGGHGHHGGAWKVAYADFVTAMMAFFLLMWLLNVTTEEQKNAISNYFDPTHPVVSSELSGSGGILGGMTMSPEGAQVSNVQSIAAPAGRVTPRSGMAKGDQTEQLGTSEHEGDTFDPNLEGRVASDTDKGAKEDGENNLQDGFNVLSEMEKLEQQDLEQMKAIIEEFENTNFEEIKEQIIQEVEKSPELANLMDNLMVDITPEGLRIQIIDSEGRSMFPIGKANMHGFMKELVNKVTQVIIPQSNQISVRGHTDGKPYPVGATYNNWNLSSDRALASHRAMVDTGLEQNRVENVVGRADREHFLPDEPLSPRNRRISIVLLREKLKNADEIKEKAAEVVKKIQEKAAAQRELEEDREDAPQFEQVIEGSTTFTIEDSQIQQDKPDNGDADVGPEIKKVRENAQKRNTTPPRIIELPVPSEPTSNNNTQVLDFP